MAKKPFGTSCVLFNSDWVRLSGLSGDWKYAETTEAFLAPSGPPPPPTPASFAPMPSLEAVPPRSMLALPLRAKVAGGPSVLGHIVAKPNEVRWGL